MLRPHPLDAISLGKIVQVRERLMAAAAAGQAVYRLESGDPSFAVPPHVVEAMDAAARAGRTHYGPTTGIPELRAALRRKLERRNGIVLPDDASVFVTNGAMHALFVTFAALLDPGDEVLLPDPMWTEVAEHVRLARGVATGVPLEAARGFAYDPAAIRRRIGPATRAIFVNTPHNPTGALLDEATLLEIVRIADERGLWIVSDEAYEDVTFAPHRHVSIAALAQRHFGVDAPVARRVVTLHSFSKSHAMSGLRVGSIATAHPLLKDRLPKAIRVTINNVNGVAQWGALAAVEGPQDHLATMRAVYAERRTLLLDALGAVPGVHAFAPPGGFFVWARLDPSLYARLGVVDADALCDALAAAGVGSAPGSAFAVGPDVAHCADALRFSFSCETAMVREGAALLRRLLAGERPLPVDAAAAAPATAARPRVTTPVDVARPRLALHREQGEGAHSPRRGAPAPLDLAPPRPRPRDSSRL